MPDPKRDEARARPADPAGAERPPAVATAPAVVPAVQPAEVVVQGRPMAEPAPPIPESDEVQPGGRYFVNGRWVDAHGNPIKDDEGKDKHAAPPEKS